MRNSKLFISLASLALLASQAAYATEYKEIVADGKVMRRFPLLSVRANQQPLMLFSTQPLHTPRHADLSVNAQWPVEDQGNLGTCATFASVGTVEYYTKKALSEECLLRFRGGYKGDWPARVTSDISKYGLTTPTTFKFTDGRQSIDCTYNDVTMKRDLTGSQYTELVSRSKLTSNGKGFVFENVNDTEDALGDHGNSFEYIKTQLDKGNPVIIGLALPSSKNPQSFIIQDDDGSEYTNTGKVTIDATPDDTCDGVNVSGGNYEGEVRCPGHAVVLVGYDEDKKVFKFRNSWSANWGKGGYGTLTYKYLQDYRIGPTTVSTSQK